MNVASKIVFKHFFRPENKIFRSLPVYHPITPRPPEETMEPIVEPGKEDSLDLNGYLITHPSNTFLVKVSNEPTAVSGIHAGDILVVDQTMEVRDGNLIVGSMGNSFIVSFVKFKNKQLYLTTDGAQPDKAVTPELKLSIWGVVSYTIHKPALKAGIERNKPRVAEPAFDASALEVPPLAPAAV